MNSFVLLISIFFFSLGLSAQDAELEPIPGQRASGVAANDLQWNVYFNFPRCENEGAKKGAWCLRKDYVRSLRSNGVDEHLKSWITNPRIKSIYMSYFSFSNNSIARALCYETSKRDLNVQIYLDAGPGQTDGLYSNLERAERKLIERANEGSIEYTPGCIDRIYKKMKKRGTGGCCDNGYFLQHAKIFMALEKESLFEKAWQLPSWLNGAGRIRFTSSSANMSTKGTATHFENWMFFNAKSNDSVAIQNVCTLWAFGQTQFFDNHEEDVSEQRKRFKKAYSNCQNQQVPSAYQRKDMSFYMVPSFSNNAGEGPSGALRNMLNRYGKDGRKVRVAIHRLTTSAVRNPLIRAKNRGARVTVLMDDDSLRSSLYGAGSGLDVNYLDASSYRRLNRAGLGVRFVETNGGPEYRHLFHNKFIAVGKKRLFQGAGNFTATALNAFGRDGSYEQFYVIKNRKIIQAYVDGWEYLKGISSSRSEHPDGDKPDNCKKDNPGGGLPLLVSCDEDGAEHY